MSFQKGGQKKEYKGRKKNPLSGNKENTYRLHLGKAVAIGEKSLV